MRDGWNHIRLGELVDQVKEPVKVERGRAYKLLGVRWYGKGPFVRETVTSETSKATRLFPVQPGDFIYNRLFAWKGSFGLISSELGGCFVSSEFPLFRVRQNRLDAALLNMVMCQPSKWAQIEIESTGSTSVSRNRWKEDRFLEQVLFLPPLSVQRRIVDLVASVDAYIDSLQQQVDSARRARNAVLHELLSAGGDDWTETTLGAHIKIVMGQAPPGKYCNKDGNGVPFVKAGEFTDGFPLVREWTTNPLRFSKLGDTLICVVGATCGKLSKGIDCAIGRSVAALQPLETLDGGFLWSFMARKVQEMRDGSRGSAQGVITKDDLADLPLGLPPLVEQKRIVEIVSSMDEVIQLSVRAVADAKNLRSGLLSDLLSGEHEIPKSYDKLLGDK
jgi:type I restriction enzyme S subunit